RQPQGPRWPSFGVAAAATAALFVLAFVSMRSIAPWSDQLREPSSAPVVVPLRPPPSVAKPVDETPVVSRTTPPTRRREIERSAPVPTPALPIIPPTVTPIAPPVAAPVVPSLPVDTSRARDIAPQVSTVPTMRHNSGLSDAEMTIRGNATYAPAGVTSASPAKNSAKVRDSIITEKLALVPELARMGPMSSESRGTIDQSQSQARALAQRSTSVGMHDLYVPMGEGVGGVGAVNGGKTGLSMGPNGLTYSVPFPLFSSGPSPEERRRNEKLLAEYLAYLRRQNDRILLKRDSIRADSAFRAANSKIVP
ncbi:MAG TPA: hypothetical protein VI259_21995, partial [Gemmatimonadaceae bacterium]